MFEDEEEYNFSPTLRRTKKFVKVESFYRQGQPIMQTIADLELAKQQKIDSLRREKEFLELKECCFAPKAVPLKVSRSCTNIRGIDRFMELKTMADRKKEEQRQREAKAFKVKTTDGGQRATVPKPFNLHPSKKDERLSRTQRILENKFRQECTFKPLRSYFP
jgi:hypothetical protein